MEKVTPYNQEVRKKVQVENMFDSIAGKYDFLNHFLSFGIDRHWRKKMISILKKYPHQKVLDIATGTGDLAIAASKLNPDEILGIDLSEKMLQAGREKIYKLNLQDIIQLKKGDAENIEYPDNSFDAVIVAFGIRNFEDLELGLSEIRRVLKPGGVLLALEFSKPRVFPVKQLYNFYSKTIMPLAGKKISGDKMAYTYLPESVKAFPEGEEMTGILEKTGFLDTRHIPLTFRIATIYFGIK